MKPILNNQNLAWVNIFLMIFWGIGLLLCILSDNLAPLWMRLLIFFGLGSLSFVVAYKGHQQHRQQVQEFEEQYLALFQVSPLPLMIYNPVTLQLIAVNQATINLYGYSEAEFLQMNMVDIRSPEDIPKFLTFMKNLPKPTAQYTGWVHRKKDGTDFEVQITSASIIWNGQAARISTIVDLTPLQDINAQAKNNEQKFHRLIEAAAEGVLVVNNKGEIILVNQQLERLFGYSREELLGHSINRLIPDTLHARHQQHMVNYYKNPANRPMGQRMELDAQHKDKHIFPVEISLTYVGTDEGIMVMALITDITQKKQAEDMRRKAETLNLELTKEHELRQMKNRFISMFAHDFRTPLAVILNIASLLNRYDDRLSLEDRQLKYQRIIQQVDKITQMLEEVMTLNRSDMGRVEFKPSWVDLEQFCREILDVFRAEREQEKRVIAFQLPSSGETAYLDKNLMHYVLTNLLSNALKYSPIDKPVEWIVAVNQQKISFMIRDYGIGIPLEDQDQLFTPFYRASNAKNILGTGLGLVIVREYVTLHGGQIALESAENAGATFTVEIPKTISPP